MEETEISLDDQHEAIHHHAAHSKESWQLWCALASAVLAVAAAVSGMYSGHFANEAMLEQIKSSDDWAYYQSKGIKAILTELRSEVITSAGKPVPAELQQKLSEYQDKKDNIKERAEEETKAAEFFMRRHETLARAVTAFQIAIAVTAMAVICRRKQMMLLTLLLALAGAYFTLSSFMI